MSRSNTSTSSIERGKLSMINVLLNDFEPVTDDDADPLMSCRSRAAVTPEDGSFDRSPTDSATYPNSVARRWATLVLPERGPACVQDAW